MKIEEAYPVRILWDDAQTGCHEWTDFDKKTIQELLEIRGLMYTVGFVVAQDSSKIIVAQNLDVNEDGDIEKIGETIRIRKENIMKLEEL